MIGTGGIVNHNGPPSLRIPGPSDVAPVLSDQAIELPVTDYSLGLRVLLSAQGPAEQEQEQQQDVSDTDPCEVTDSQLERIVAGIWGNGQEDPSPRERVEAADGVVNHGGFSDALAPVSALTGKTIETPLIPDRTNNPPHQPPLQLNSAGTQAASTKSGSPEPGRHRKDQQEVRVSKAVKRIGVTVAAAAILGGVGMIANELTDGAVSNEIHDLTKVVQDAGVDLWKGFEGY